MREYNYKREKIKLTVFFILMVLFAVATLIGGIMVIRFRYSAAYSLFPALATILFSILCKHTRKTIQKREK